MFCRHAQPFVISEPPKEALSLAAKRDSIPSSNNQNFDDTLAMLNVPKRLTSRSLNETDLDVSQLEDNSLEKQRPVSIANICVFDLFFYR